MKLRLPRSELYLLLTIVRADPISIFVSGFVDNAERIFEAAEAAARSGHALSEMTILVGAGGGIRMIVDSDWPIESLRQHHGAQMAFRVSERDATVQVDGRTGWQSCTLKSAKPERVARMLLGAPAAYALDGVYGGSNPGVSHFNPSPIRLLG